MDRLLTHLQMMFYGTGLRPRLADMANQQYDHTCQLTHQEICLILWRQDLLTTMTYQAGRMPGNLEIRHLRKRHGEDQVHFRLLPLRHLQSRNLQNSFQTFLMYLGSGQTQQGTKLTTIPASGEHWPLPSTILKPLQTLQQV